MTERHKKILAVYRAVSLERLVETRVCNYDFPYLSSPWYDAERRR